METFSMPGASSPHLPVFCRGGSVTCDQLPEWGIWLLPPAFFLQSPWPSLEPGGPRWHSWTASRVGRTLFPG